MVNFLYRIFKMDKRIMKSTAIEASMSNQKYSLRSRKNVNIGTTQLADVTGSIKQELLTQDDNEEPTKSKKTKRNPSSNKVPIKSVKKEDRPNIESIALSNLKFKKVECQSVKKEANDHQASSSNQVLPDIENVLWQPDNWEEVLNKILEMRKLHTAPVDSMGCEKCPDPNVTPEIHRYQTLVSLMLSSQTKDQVTHAATQRLIEHGLTVANILNTSDEKLGELIYPVGFWKSKVKYIKNTTQILKDTYNSDIPSTLKDLCKLPGVGPKMANLAMSIGWSQTVGIAVDTHVHRISNRLGWVQKPTKEPEKTRIALELWLPKEHWREINLTMVGFGQTVCLPVGPKCSDCLVNKLCPVGKKKIKCV